MAPRVVLVGLPGSGKSSVGAELAKVLGIDFADSDDLVTEMTGRAVGEIILDDGEPAFREIEAAAVADAVLDFDGVLSLGGGAVTTESVRSVVVESGVPVVLLTAGREILLERIDGTHYRPLLTGDTAERLNTLAEERDPFYSELATYTVETDYASVAEIAREIASRVAGPGA